MHKETVKQVASLIGRISTITVGTTSTLLSSFFLGSVLAMNSIQPERKDFPSTLSSIDCAVDFYTGTSLGIDYRPSSLQQALAMEGVGFVCGVGLIGAGAYLRSRKEEPEFYLDSLVVSNSKNEYRSIGFRRGDDGTVLGYSNLDHFLKKDYSGIGGETIFFDDCQTVTEFILKVLKNYTEREGIVFAGDQSMYRPKELIISIGYRGPFISFPFLDNYKDIISEIYIN